MAKYVSSVDGYIRSQKNKVDKVTVIDNTPKTLNNKFQIPGIRKPIIERIGPVEILEDADDEDDFFKDVSNPFNKPLFDRF